MSTRVSRRGASRAALALLALAAIVTFDGAASVVAKGDGHRRGDAHRRRDDPGKDLTPEIAAIRRSQISSENAMRHADKKLRSLKHARKVARKQIHQSNKRLERLRDRLGRTRERMQSVAIRLTAARLEAERERGVRPEPVGLGDDFGQRVRELERDMKRLKRVERKVERKTRHTLRVKRARIRSVPRMKRASAVTKGRRESAEAVLGANIKRMTDLAQLRATRQVEIKPGETGVIFGWPSRGRISQGYHRGHDGIDIVAGHGSMVRAAADGVISYVGWNPFDKGKRAFVVVIGHPGGYETIYGHLLPIRRVTIGHLIKKGQPLGLMGSTGHSTGTHVHWEVSRDFHHINPKSVL